MDVLLLAGALGGAAFLAMRGQSPSTPPRSSAYGGDEVETDTVKLCRSRSIQNALTQWNEDWELNPKRGSVSFRVTNVGNEGGGLIVALANEWRNAAAGGVAVVLCDSLPAPIENAELATVARNRSYFATMPYYNRPAMQTTTALNHRLHSNSVYVVRWDPEQIQFGRAGDKPLLVYDRTQTPDSAHVRYLAFGIFGAERLADCTHNPEGTVISGVSVVRN